MSAIQARHTRFGRLRRSLLVSALEDRTVPALFTVNTLADTDTGVGTSGSLRYVIGQANATPEADTITFTVSGTITLSQTLGFISITKSLEINGPGKGSLTISGNDSVDLFAVGDDAPVDPQLINVAFRDLTITKGKVFSANAGAIFADLTNLTLENVAVTFNYAEVNGGAITVIDGSITAKNSDFSNNTLNPQTGNFVGGAIALLGTASATFTDCTFANNVNDGSIFADGFGGAIGAIGTPGPINIINSTFTNNYADGEGGALDLDVATVNISGSTFSGNKASASGGAIIVGGTTGGKLTVTDTKFLNNILTKQTGNFIGGAVAVAGIAESTFTNTLFDGNKADGAPTGKNGFAGAIGSFGTGKMTIESSTISNSFANAFGGAIFFNTGADLIINNSTFFNNSASSAGGTIWLAGATGTVLKITNSTFQNNATANSGGVFATNAGNVAVTIQNSTFFGNTASGGNGGVIRTYGTYEGAISFLNSTASANAAGNSGGGGALNLGGTAGGAASLTIVSSVIAGNKAAGSLTNAGADFTKTAGTASVDFSLIGVNPGATIFTTPTPGSNLIGTTAAPLDAKLQPLVNYGGLTKTMIPGPGSPAINVGLNPGGLLFDQRGTGFPREHDGKPDMGAVEAFNPTPTVNSVNAPAVTTAGATNYEFTITFQDNNAIDVSTLETPGAVKVSGGGFGTPVSATFVNVDVPGNGTPRTATYKITPPGGSWDLTDNGTYSISITAGTIFDTDTPTKLSVPGGAVGTFLVGLPQTFVVNAINDEAVDTDGLLSFREAVALANKAAGADTIIFDPAVFASDTTISYTLAAITVTDSVTILGPTAVKVTLDAALIENHLKINGPGVLEVSIKNLAFVNGNLNSAAFGALGGSVYVSDENVTFENCLFDTNTSKLNGGAIGGTTGNLTVLNSTFYGNRANFDFGFSGGAISMEGTGKILISGNTFGFLDTVTGLPDPTKANIADGSGGAILLVGQSEVVITNNKFYGNINRGDGSVGGAVLVSSTAPGATAKITGNTFIGNISESLGTTGGRGGALAFIGVLNATVEDNLFQGNNAPNGVGGAIWVRATATDSVTLTVSRSSFIDNEVGGTGFAGAIGVTNPGATAKITVIESTFKGNKSANNGGAIGLNDGGFLTVIGSTFQGNTALGSGGAIDFRVLTAGKTGTLLVSNTTISGNEAFADGGGIAVTGAGVTATVQNSTLALNSVKGGGSIGGGGLAVSNYSGSTLKISSTIIATNTDPNFTNRPDVGSDTALTTSGNNNLIGVADGTGLTFGGTGHKTGTSAAPLNPQLNPLANNKGPTLTHSLKAGSPALNAGNNDAGLTSDQRGAPYVRVFGSQADIGAFEDQPLDPAITATVKVDDGTDQRSRITSLTVTFSAPVTFVGAPEAAFQLVQAGTANAVTLAAAVAGPVVTLTFSGPLTEATSLKDGNYQLTVFASQIVGSFNGGGGPGSNLVFGPTSGNKGLYRLYGDADGDRDVDFNDFLQFRSVFGTPATPTGPGYFFNIDGSANIDFTDFLAFRTRFGTSLAP